MMQPIVDHLWQSTLCVVVAWLLTLALRNNAARVRYWVWLAASIKFLIPFSLLTWLGSQFSWRSSAPNSNDTFFATVQQFVEPLSTPEIVLRSPQAQTFDFIPILLSIWCAGAILLLIRWGLSWWRVVSAAGAATPVAVQAPIAVKSTPVMSEPGVVGVLRPVLLLPEGIASRLTPEQLQAVLAHELCHVRRRDNLTAAIHMIVQALFWFHPLVWWIGARLIEERERACDEGVVELGNEPQAYAEGILKVCQFYMESKLACVAGVSGANLRHRVESIMNNRVVEGLNAAKQALLVGVSAVAISAPLFFGLLTTQAVDAQTAATGLQQFDQVSIQAAVPAVSKENEVHWHFMKDGNFSIKDHSLRYLILFAYDLHDTQLVGAPAWIDTTKFDIEAKKAGIVDDTGNGDPLQFRAYRQLARNLLAERFGIRSHEETRNLSAYVLSRGSEEPKLAIEPPVKLPSFLGTKTDIKVDKSGITFRDAPLHWLVRDISGQLKLPVIDQTSLTGRYNFRWDKPVDPNSLPAEIERQFGLKLKAQLMPLKVVVIDEVLYPTLDPAPASQSAAGNSLPEFVTGERVNMRFRDQEVREVLKAISLVANQNIVVDSRVSGTITVAFDNIPWDEALNEIVQAKGLVMTRKGNLILIASKG